MAMVMANSWGRLVIPAAEGTADDIIYELAKLTTVIGRCGQPALSLQMPIAHKALLAQAPLDGRVHLSLSHDPIASHRMNLLVQTVARAQWPTDMPGRLCGI